MPTHTQNMDRSTPVIVVSIAKPGSATGDRLDLSDQVIAMTYEDDESKADKCSLTINNFELDNFDNPLWQKGRVLQVTWGYPGELAPVREVVIQKVTGLQQLKIEGYSKSILMHKEKKSRVFEGMSRAQVVQQIAEEQGFFDDKQQIEDTVVTLPTITQARETDAEFVKRMAKQEGFEFYVDFDGFHFHKRQLGQKPLRVFHYYTDPNRGDVLSCSVDNDVTTTPGKVSVKGRNPKTKKNISEVGSNTETKRDGLGAQVEVKAPEETESLTLSTEDEELFFETATTVVGAPNPSGTTTATTVPLKNAQDPTGAKRQADGHYSKAALATVQLSMSVVGDPSLLAKTVMEVRGLGKRLSGNYYIKSVNHSLAAGNYTCALKARSDGHNGYALTGGSDVVRVPSKATVNAQPGDDANPDTLTVTSSLKLSTENEGQELEFHDQRGRQLAGPKGLIPE